MNSRVSRRKFLAASALTLSAAPYSRAADKEELPDYEKLLNEKLRRDITPDRNANALLVLVFGPTPDGRALPAEYLKWLGIERPPKDGKYFVGLYQFQTDYLKLATDVDVLGEQLKPARERPWKAEDYPQIAAWLQLNERPLAVAVEATRRPEYFSPLVATRKGKERGPLVNALLQTVQKCRDVANALTARAMLRLGEGKPDEVWPDLLACHRLARLVGRGGMLIEGLISVAIDTIAHDGVLGYLNSVKLTAKQIQDRLKDLQALPPIPAMADQIDRSERYIFLDCLQYISRGRLSISGIENDLKPTEEERKALAMIDWNPAFQTGNQWYDRIVAALRIESRAERLKAFEKMEKELEQMQKVMKGSDDLAKLLTKPDEKVAARVAGRSIGNQLILLLMPATRKVGDYHDRAEQNQRNLHLAFALAAYRAEQGRYPAKLDDVAPKYLAAIPDDLFSGKPLIYRPDEKGFLLYSVGVNGKDDGGRGWGDDPPGGDDLSVRLPLPELKKK